MLCFCVYITFEDPEIRGEVGRENVVRARETSYSITLNSTRSRLSAALIGAHTAHHGRVRYLPPEREDGAWLAMQASTATGSEIVGDSRRVARQEREEGKTGLHPN